MCTKDGAKKGSNNSGSRPTTRSDSTKPQNHGRITSGGQSSSPGHKGGKGNGR